MTSWQQVTQFAPRVFNHRDCRHNGRAGHKRRPLCVEADKIRLRFMETGTACPLFRGWDEDDTLINSSTYTSLEFEKGPEILTVREEDRRCWAESPFKDQSTIRSLSTLAALPPPSSGGRHGVSRTSCSRNPKQNGFPPQRKSPRPGRLLGPRSQKLR